MDYLTGFDPEILVEKARFAWSSIEPFEIDREYNFLLFAIQENKYIDFYNDIKEVFFWFLVITAVHLFTRFAIFTPIAYKVLPPGLPPKGKEAKPGDKPLPPSDAMVRKFITAFWKGTSYSFLTFFAYYCIGHEDFFYDTTLFWRRWPMEITPLIKTLYFVEFAYYFHATAMLMFDTKMSDTAELALHHFATVMLMALSYCMGFFRIGVVIMILHDFSDPWMEYAKLCLYTKKELPANLFFAFFTAAFYYTRLYLYPRYILTSVWFQARHECPYCSGWWTFNIFLFTLQVLHIFWAILIMKILINAIFSKGVEKDIREEE